MATVEFSQLARALGAEKGAALRAHMKELAEAPASTTALQAISWLLASKDQAEPARRTTRWGLCAAPAQEMLLQIALNDVMRAPGYSSAKGMRAFRRFLVTSPGSLFGMQMGGMVLREAGAEEDALRMFYRARMVDPADSFVGSQIWKLESGYGWQGKGSVGDIRVPDGDKEVHRKFFLPGTVRFFPKRVTDFADVPSILARDIFHGFLPSTPPIRSDRPIVAMGSCFAQHIRQHLRANGRLSDHVGIPEGLNNTFAVRQFVDWVAGNDALVYSYEKGRDGTMERWDADKDRGPYRQAVASAGGFVVTIGLAEVWRDKRTGGVFWRGIPQDRFDPDIHEHVVSTVEENTRNLEAIADGLRALAGDVPVVFTLSPVPLNATMRQDFSIFAADAVSKSILRVAIDQMMSARPPGVHYWPSFEAFRWLGAHLERSLFDGEANPRHPSPDLIRQMIDLFIEHFIDGAPARENRPGGSDRTVSQA